MLDIFQPTTPGQRRECKQKKQFILFSNIILTKFSPESIKGIEKSEIFKIIFHINLLFLLGLKIKTVELAAIFLLGVTVWSPFNVRRINLL